MRYRAKRELLAQTAPRYQEAGHQQKSVILPIRRDPALRGISTTRAGPFLKHQIPVRTFTDWDDAKPGFFEIDLVAHCGGNAEGAYLYTLVLTDVATGWTECLPLLNKGQHGVVQDMTQVRQFLPMPLMGIDSDNGKEFLNNELLDYCERESITFTRGRAYKKNDQCGDSH